MRTPIVTLASVGRSRLHDLEVELELESFVSKFDHWSMFRYVARGLRSERASRSPAWMPRHWAARVLSASCAYKRHAYDRPFTDSDWDKARRLLGERSPGCQAEALGIKKSLGQYFSLMYAEQIELQHPRALHDFYRANRLLCDRKGMAPLKSLDGFPSPETWIAACASIWIQSQEDPDGAIDAACLHLDLPKYFLESDTTAVVNHLSMFPWEVGQEYRKRRAMIESPKLRGLARPIYLDVPCIRYDEYKLLVPFADLVAKNCYEQYARYLWRSPQQEAFATRVEHYLDELMFQGGQADSRMMDREMAALFRSRAADRYYRQGDRGLLVEVKATFNAFDVIRGVEPSEIARSSAATKLRNAGDQILQARAGLVDRGFPVTECGAIITLSHLFRANAPEVKREIFGDMAKVVVLDLPTFELAIAVANHTGQHVSELFDAYLEQDYMKVGELNTYLDTVGGENMKYPRFMHENSEVFWDGVLRKMRRG